MHSQLALKHIELQRLMGLIININAPCTGRPWMTTIYIEADSLVAFQFRPENPPSTTEAER